MSLATRRNARSTTSTASSGGRPTPSAALALGAMDVVAVRRLRASTSPTSRAAGSRRSSRIFLAVVVAVAPQVLEAERRLLAALGAKPHSQPRVRPQ